MREHGFLGVVVDTTNLEGSIWTWWREGGRFLYVACWATGETRQYDVTDPRKPTLAGSVHNGKRVCWTNLLYSTRDDQFYPDGLPGAQFMANALPSGGLEPARDYWVSFPDGYRAQIRGWDGHWPSLPG